MSRRSLRALAVAGGVVAALLGWVVIGPIADADLAVSGNGRTVTVGPAQVTFLSVAAGLLGWGVLALLERVTRHARLAWTIVAGLALVLSFAPLTEPSMSPSTRIALGALHVLVAAVLIPVMWRTAARPAST